MLNILNGINDYLHLTAQTKETYFNKITTFSLITPACTIILHGFQMQVLFRKSIKLLELQLLFEEGSYTVCKH